VRRCLLVERLAQRVEHGSFDHPTQARYPVFPGLWTPETSIRRKMERLGVEELPASEVSSAPWPEQCIGGFGSSSSRRSWRSPPAAT
jgi:hypothetical protein